MNIAKGVSAVAFGATMGALAGRFPLMREYMEFLAQQERSEVALRSLGTNGPDIERMKWFVSALAETTIVSNREVIEAAWAFNIRRVAMGEEFAPTDILAWAEDFMRDSMAQMLVQEYRQMGVDLNVLYFLDSEWTGEIADAFFRDVARLWSESARQV